MTNDNSASEVRLRLSKRELNTAASRGFTVVELIVATAVALGIAAVMFSIVGGTLQTWRRVSSNVAQNSQIKTIFDYLVRDLQAALFRNDGNTYFAFTALPDSQNSGVWNPYGSTELPAAAVLAVHAKPGNNSLNSFNQDVDEIANVRGGVAGGWLRFFTTKQDPEGISAPVAVAYQLVRRAVQPPSSETGADIRWMLFRSEVSPKGSNSTFSEGYDLPAWQAGAGTGYVGQNASPGNPGNLRRPPLDRVLANNVIDFAVRLFVREFDTATGNWELRLVYPAIAPDVPEPSVTEFLARSGGDPYLNAMPDVVEVMVRILTEQGAQAIQNLEAGRLGAVPPVSADIDGSGDVEDGEWWWSIALAHSRVFTQRVEIMGVQQ